MLTEAEFATLGSLLRKLAMGCHDASRRQGFWESQTPYVDGAKHEAAAKIGLLMSECAELLEAWRLEAPFGPCAKDPELSNVAEEAADVGIRLLDLCQFLGVDLGAAMQRKIAYNATRPYKHSKRF